MSTSDVSKKEETAAKGRMAGYVERILKKAAESDESKKQTALAKLAGSIEHILKIAGALVAIAYVFGLIVLNVHLGRYGYHSLGLLQIDYVAAGFWSLSPIAFVCLLIFTVIYSLVQDYLFEDSNSNNPKPESRTDKVIAGIIIWLLLYGLFFYALDITFRKLWLLALFLGLFVGIGLGIFPIMMAAAKAERERLLLGVMLIWVFVFLPFYLIFFGRYIYVTIPDKWGGGQMAEVVLVAKDDAARTLIESAGVQFMDARKSAPVKLILGTEKELFILPAQQSRGLKLNHDLVVAVIYSK